MNTIQPAFVTTPEFARRPPSVRFSLPTAVLLAVFLLLIYGVFPTQNHYWDGIGFALNIEGIGANGQGVVQNQGDLQQVTDIYFNPNHLFYNFLGFIAYRPLHSFFPGLRALAMLQAASVLLSVGSSCFLFLILCRWCRDLWLSVWLTLLMALSATWWKFSTDANVYVPSTFLLILATYLATDSNRRPPVWTIGVLHALSMLVHQIAIFFLPAAVILLWTHPYWLERSEKRRAVMQYLLAAGIPVAAAYAWVWLAVLRQPASSHDFLAWLTSNGSDTFAYRSVGASVLESLRSLLRVFFGGRISLAVAFVNPPLLIFLCAAMAGSLVVFARKLRLRGISERFAASIDNGEPVLPAANFILVWVGVFTAFLTIWLTEYPYYRLFYLPAIIFLTGAIIQKCRYTGLRRDLSKTLAAFVVFMAAFNFCAYIYPYSKSEATPPVLLAHEVSTLWSGDVVVLYKDFTCDNWIVRYFNPRTTWIRTDLADTGLLGRQLQSAQAKRQSVWLDTTLLGEIETAPDKKSWFEQYGGLSTPWGVVNKKHHIRFSRIRMQ